MVERGDPVAGIERPESVEVLVQQDVAGALGRPGAGVVGGVEPLDRTP